VLLPLPLLCCAVEMTNGSLSASLHITASHTAWCVCCTLFDIILCGCRMTLLYHSICRSLSVYLTCLHLLAVSCEPFRGSGTRFVAFKAVFLGKDWSIGKKSPTDHQQTVLRHCWQSPCQWQAGRGDIFDGATSCKWQWGVPDTHAACIRTVSRGTSTCLKPQMLRLLQLLFFQESTWSMSRQCLPLDTSLCQMCCWVLFLVAVLFILSDPPICAVACCAVTLSWRHDQACFESYPWNVVMRLFSLESCDADSDQQTACCSNCACLPLAAWQASFS